jgi:protoporphyrinogen IX oxidase
MGGWLGNFYLWIKAAHIIFVIFWMAGLFMLPRFLVYHQEAEVGSPEDRLWAEREARLIRIILNPSLIAVWIAGLALALDVGAFSMAWFWPKLLLVIGLSGYQGWMSGYSKGLAKGERSLDGRTLRIINEVPGLAAIAIVLLVVIRPFS